MVQQQQAVLAIDSVADSEVVVDALPYVDTVTPEERKAADALIVHEQKRGKKRPSDYLAELPSEPSSRFKDHPLLKAEQARVEAQQPLAGIDTVRFQLPPPKQGNNDYSAWRKAADNAYSQLEHQYNRLLNLELGVKYAPNAWRVHNEQLEGIVKRLQAEVQQLRQQQESLNKNRKLSQEAVHRHLKAKQAEYQGYVRKNLEIAAACATLEAEIATLSES